jgi:hypothetical protein
MTVPSNTTAAPRAPAIKRPPNIVMGKVNPVGAVKLAAWLYQYHPTIFRKMLASARVAQKTNAAPGTALPTSKVVSLSQYRARRTVSGLGDLSSILSSIGSSLDSSASSAISSAVAAPSASGSSGGFWSSLGSDLSSAGSSVLSGVSDVGSYLTTGGGLGALTGLANNYFAAQSQSSVINAQAAQQQAILQAQAQAVARGGYPQPVSYTTNALGQQVPMYSGAAGMIPITGTNFSTIFQNTSWIPWALGGGVALIALIMLMK